MKLPKRPTKNWWRMAEIYRHFAKTAEKTGFVCDFSDEAALQMFIAETYGGGRAEIKPNNGFAIGKKWMDVTVAEWLESLNGFGRDRVLNAYELYADPTYPHWWLDKVIPERLQTASKEAAKEIRVVIENVSLTASEDDATKIIQSGLRSSASRSVLVRSLKQTQERPDAH